MAEAIKGKRPIFIPETGKYAEVSIYDRYRLPIGVKIEGPAVIEERESTIVLNGPGKAWVDSSGCVILQLPRH